MAFTSALQHSLQRSIAWAVVVSPRNVHITFKDLRVRQGGGDTIFVMVKVRVANVRDVRKVVQVTRQTNKFLTDVAHGMQLHTDDISFASGVSTHVVT